MPAAPAVRRGCARARRNSPVVAGVGAEACRRRAARARACPGCRGRRPRDSAVAASGAHRVRRPRASTPSVVPARAARSTGRRRVAVAQRVRERLLHDAVDRDLVAACRAAAGRPVSANAHVEAGRAHAASSSASRSSSDRLRRRRPRRGGARRAARRTSPSAPRGDAGDRVERARRRPRDRVRAAKRAPSACAITTASECATTSCMSRAMRLRSCSTT